MSEMKQLLANAEKTETCLKLLTNKNSLMILCNLVEGERSVAQINDLIPLAQSVLSQHLASLRTANMVTTQRDAQTIYYCLDDDTKQILLQLYRMFCEN